GTVDYMAPEQARCVKQIDGRADLYSVGAMFYHLLAGQLPFASNSFTSMLYSHAYEQPAPLAAVVPEAPPAIVALIHQLLEKEPQKRPPNCAAVLKALEPFRTLEFRSQFVSEAVERVAKRSAEASVSTAHEPLSSEYGVWQKFQDHVQTVWGRQRPQWLAEMQSLEQQLTEEIEVTQRRLQRLRSLREEGQQLLNELAIDATTQQAETAARQASLGDQLAFLDLEIAKAGAQHARLTSQRDVLSARMQVVGARRRAKHQRQLWPLVLVVGAAVLLVSLGYSFWPRAKSDQPLVMTPTPTEPKPLPPESVNQPVELLPLLSLPEDVVNGTWTLSPDGKLTGGGGLGGAQQGHARLQIPARPQGDYELTAIFTCDGAGDANLVFPLGSGNARAVFGHQGIPGGIAMGAKGDNVLIDKPNSFEPFVTGKQLHRATITVRIQQAKVHIVLVLDDQQLLDWQGAPHALSVNAPCQIRDPRAIGLTTSRSGVCFHSVQLTMLSGKLEIDREQAAPPSYVEGSVEPLTAAITANPTDAEAHRRRGNWYLARQQWLAAANDMEAIFKLRPDDLATGGDLATIHLRLEDQSAYDRICASLCQRLPAETETWKTWHSVRALLLGAKPQPKHWQVAEAKFLEMEQHTPEDSLLVRWRPLKLYRQGNWQACVTAADTYLPNGPDTSYSYSIWIYRAMALQRLGRGTEAQASLAQSKRAFEQLTFETAWKGRTESKEQLLWWWNLDGMHTQIAYREASELILGQREELVLAPIMDDTPSAAIQEAMVLFAKGRNLFAEQKWQAAQQAFAAGLLLHPAAGFEHADYASLCLMVGDEAATRQEFPRLFTKVLDPQLHRDGRIQMLRVLTLRPAPVADFQKIGFQAIDLREQPKWSALVNAGLVYRQGKWSEAERVAREYLQQHTNDNLNEAEAMLWHAMALWQTGERELARTTLMAAGDSAKKQRPVPGAPAWYFAADKLYTTLLYREASQLILGSSQEVTISTE
ncbi:MAG TPA: hypothetical protein VL096_09890, partial [Pirellulaceae bacterium]|nr:hypothetical protein [Pirellulaceae bacterium]